MLVVPVPADRTSVQAALELVVGSMFSDKSEELIHRVTRALIARRAVQVFKPALDARCRACCHQVARRSETWA